METIVILEQVPEFFLSGLQDLGYETIPGYQYEEHQLNNVLEKASGIAIRSKSKVDKNFLSKTPRLKFILRPGSGLENVDLDAVKAKNIRLINSPEGNKEAVAEHCLGMLLGLLHNIPKANQAVKNGFWLREENRGTELLGLTVGIIGFGNTGSAFAKKLQSLGVRILVYDKYREIGNDAQQYVHQDALEVLQAEADVISFHVPYNRETHYYFNTAFIENLTKPVYIINTSRGKILNTADLIAGLKQRQIKGACLDVLENEEPENFTAKEKHLFNDLVQMGEVIITPHIAGWSHSSEKGIYQILLEKLKDIFF